MASETTNTGILALGEILSQLVRNQTRRRAVDRSEEVLGRLTQSQPSQTGGMLTDPEFLRGVQARQAVRPESALQEIDTSIEPGLLGTLRGEKPVDLANLDQFGAAESAISSFFPGQDPMSQRLRLEFGERIQEIRQRAELQSIAEPLGNALGIDPAKVSPTTVNTILSLMRATPSQSSQFSFATVQDARGNFVTLRRNTRTGEIDVQPSGVKGAEKFGPFVTVGPDGEITAFQGGGKPPTFSPRAQALEKGKAKETLSARNQKRFARRVFGTLQRAGELDDGSLVGGRGGSINRGLQSAAQQMKSLAKGVGVNVPSFSVSGDFEGKPILELFPEGLRDAAKADTRTASIAYELAVAKARFNNPQAADIAAREVERELEFTAGALLSGDPAQRAAARQEIALTILRDFNTNVADIEGVQPLSDAEIAEEFPGLFTTGSVTNAPNEARTLDELETVIPAGEVLEFDAETGTFKRVGSQNAP